MAANRTIEQEVAERLPAVQAVVDRTRNAGVPASTPASGQASRSLQPNPWDYRLNFWLGRASPMGRRRLEMFQYRRVIVENAKCAIVKACLTTRWCSARVPSAPKGTPSRSTPARPRPAEEGHRQVGVKYLKANFLPTRTFGDLADLSWVLDEAGKRQHGPPASNPWCCSRWSGR